MESPLRALLKERIAATLPDPTNYPDWEQFILSKLKESIEQLLGEHDLKSLDQLTWGTIHTTEISHPLGFIPMLGKMLNMPQKPLPGGYHCVRATSASERMVISPGREAGWDSTYTFRSIGASFIKKLQRPVQLLVERRTSTFPARSNYPHIDTHPQSLTLVGTPIK